MNVEFSNIETKDIGQNGFLPEVYFSIGLLEAHYMRKETEEWKDAPFDGGWMEFADED